MRLQDNKSLFGKREANVVVVFFLKVCVDLRPPEQTCWEGADEC